MEGTTPSSCNQGLPKQQIEVGFNIHDVKFSPLLDRARSDVDPYHTCSVSPYVILSSNDLIGNFEFLLRDVQSASGPQRAYIDGRAIINQSHRYIELPI